MARRSLALGLALLFAACGPAAHDHDHGGEPSTGLALNAVPQVVRDAASKAVPGLAIESVAESTYDGAPAFHVIGTAKGMRYELDLSPDGALHEVDYEAAEDHGHEHGDHTHTHGDGHDHKH